MLSVAVGHILNWPVSTLMILMVSAKSPRLLSTDGGKVIDWRFPLKKTRVGRCEDTTSEPAKDCSFQILCQNVDDLQFGHYLHNCYLSICDRCTLNLKRYLKKKSILFLQNDPNNLTDGCLTISR